MANFSEAYLKMLPHEGGYANVAYDKGGETYGGISRKFFPEWPGWRIVDAHKPVKNGGFVHDEALDKMLMDFYRINFWSKMRGDEIIDQKVANFIFDWFVNSGSVAIKKAQTLVGVIADGAMGLKTIEAINKYGETLFVALKGARITFVKDIARNNSTQQKFLNGWLNRIEEFK